MVEEVAKNVGWRQHRKEIESKAPEAQSMGRRGSKEHVSIYITNPPDSELVPPTQNKFGSLKTRLRSRALKSMFGHQSVVDEDQFFPTSISPFRRFMHKKEWRKIFQTETFDAFPARSCCMVLAPVFFLSALTEMFSSERYGGGMRWSTYNSLPFWFGFLLTATVGITVNLTCFREIFALHYNLIMSAFVVCVFSCLTVDAILLELRLILFQAPFAPQISWNMTFDHGWPVQVCNDSNPVKTLIYWPMFNGIGCEGAMLSGESYGYRLGCLVLPILLRMSGKSALIVAFINTSLHTISIILIGHRDIAIVTAAVFLLSCGLSSAYFCACQTVNDQDQYVLTRGTRYATDQSRKLVSTLIPENVLNRLAAQRGDAMLGVRIPQCCIMFCSLEPQVLLKSRPPLEVFDLLDEIFEAFDSAVEKHGMYKYQHVGDWYIITCPRACRPFDEELQASNYPPSYFDDMVRLGKELIQISRRFKIAEVELSLRVGISFGSAAGAVIGVHRAFYCVYGDTTNTAARMCKAARPNQILCSENFASAILHFQPSKVICRHEGCMLIKGKGELEVFDVNLRHSNTIISRQELPQTRLESHRSRRSIFRSLIRMDSAVSSASRRSLSLQSSAAEEQTYFGGMNYEIDKTRMKFKDHETEEMFLAETARSQRVAITIGLFTHFLAVMCGFHFVNYPEQRYNYAEFGDDALQGDKDRVRILLTTHLLVVIVWTVGLVLYMWRGVHVCRIYQWHVVGMKLIFLAVSCSASLLVPLQGWLIIFSSLFVSINSIATGFRFVHIFVVNVATCILVTVFILLSNKGQVEKWLIIIEVLVTCAAISWLGRRICFSEKEHWRQARLYEAELQRLKQILVDLIPSNVAQHMIRCAAKMQCLMQRAVVLQLDLCNFTKMSQEKSAMEMATMVHELFLAFDRGVMLRGLYKMDTVGDAYIVAGWLSCDRDWFLQEDTKSRCASVLSLAHLMLESMADYRERTGKEVNCRIGVSIGVVATGLLGRMQSRFHIVGQTMLDVDALESSARINCVHVSDKFLRGLGCIRYKQMPLLPSCPPRSGTSFFRRMSSAGPDSYELLETCEDGYRPGRRAGRNSVAEVEKIEGEVIIPLGWRSVEERERKEVASGLSSAVDGEYDKELVDSNGLDYRMCKSYILELDERTEDWEGESEGGEGRCG